MLHNIYNRTTKISTKYPDQKLREYRLEEDFYEKKEEMR